MADAAVFDAVCEQLEARTPLDRLAARGTVRIALKEAGLEPASVTPDEIAVVIARVLPAHLERRGVGDAAAVCEALAQRARQLTAAAGPETPEAVFRRLGRTGRNAGR